MKFFFALFALLVTVTMAGAQDAPSGGPQPEKDKQWKLQPQLSNEFNFKSLNEKQFADHWVNQFINQWTGPGKTYWNADQAYTAQSKFLAITATKFNNRIYAGCVSTKATVSYPVYIETKFKLSDSPMASNVWLLSSDSTEEIDILEAYGSKDHDHFSRVLHLSHHIFDRGVGGKVLDYQPESEATWYRSEDDIQWADQWHTIGVHWQDPWTLSYYVNGKLVRTTPKKEIDPMGYTTTGKGLTKPMHIVINMEAQPWREEQGIDFLAHPAATDPNRNTMYIDWVRVWKPE